MDPTSLVSNMWHQRQHQQQFQAVGLPPGMMSRGDASVEGSIVTDHSAGSRARAANARRRRRGEPASVPASEDESSKLVSTSSGNDLTDSEAKHTQILKSTEENANTLKVEADTDSGPDNKPSEQNRAPPEPPKQDYIHVRARRGQATDSHSLAERARREKISERMKMLQDLVPGCNKVIGKASVLDEIINYIQALQRQVEFLSMKLEAVNSQMNTSGIESGFPSKDFGAQTYNPAPSLPFEPQTSREYNQNSAPEWLHMQVGGAFERVT